ncbi:MAG: hypothetical protein ACOWWO_17820 [Peptococcaceae bacterium]
MIIIAYILSLAVLISLLYISYCMLTGKPLFINCFLFSIIIMSYFFWHPNRIYTYITRIRDLSSPHLDWSLSYYISPILFQVFMFLLVSVFFMFLYKDNYCFFNTKKNTQAIAEQALENIGIPFESLEKSTKINENANLQYITLGLFRWQYVNISFNGIGDKVLKKQIIKEIRNTMCAYRKPNNRILGFLVLSFLLVYIYEVVRDLLSLL